MKGPKQPLPLIRVTDGAFRLMVGLDGHFARDATIEDVAALVSALGPRHLRSLCQAWHGAWLRALEESPE